MNFLVVTTGWVDLPASSDQRRKWSITEQFSRHLSTPTTAMPATRSATERRRKTQTFRKTTLCQDRIDYYKCGSCNRLLSCYHNAYKRHVPFCEARSQAVRDEEAHLLMERYTPTPEPYTQASSSEDSECKLGDGSDMAVTDPGVPILQDPCLVFPC